jgi:cysteine desulfurase
MGKSFSFIASEKDGRISEALLNKALEKNPSTRFAAIMAVNNEVGSVMEMKELSLLIRKRQPPIHFHSDIVQAIGKVPVDISDWDLDSASISAHKIGGLRGIGLLYLKNPSYENGTQESGIRAGTENVAGAINLAECLERRANKASVKEEYEKAEERFSVLINFLRSTKRAVLIPEDRIEKDRRFSPYILQVAFDKIPGEVMVRALDDEGFAVSTGSACSSHSKERPILSAMGVSAKTKSEGIRISQGWRTSREEIDSLIKAIQTILGKL